MVASVAGDVFLYDFLCGFVNILGSVVHEQHRRDVTHQDDFVAGKFSACDDIFHMGDAVQQIVNDRLAPARRDTAEYYTVKSGDTLWAIAQRYGTTYQEIARLSGIADPNKIWPGQRVRVK